MTPKDLAGKTALITGGSRGIGRAIALRLARHGANVAINYFSRDADAVDTQREVQREGVPCVLVKGDVSEPASVDSVVARTCEALGPVDLLVANAGISILESHKEISWTTWKKTLSINLDSVFLSIMAVKDGMLERKYGRIVCISSVAALRPRQRQIHYAASKGAIVSMVRCCAEAFAPHVRVNCIAPGLIETEMGAGLGPEATKSIVENTPLNRLGQPEEIANVAYFLLSDQSSFMTGQTLAVSGGRIMLP
ncbi:MAG: 3-oxoacyl-ACP reductase FabG [Acidimicrobiia bacterium]|nr:3-oxoacyl-ACP reductase FabG [Acidimicrobiia bacterium]